MTLPSKHHELLQHRIAFDHVGQITYCEPSNQSTSATSPTNTIKCISNFSLLQETKDRTKFKKKQNYQPTVNMLN